MDKNADKLGNKSALDPQKAGFSQTEPKQNSAKNFASDKIARQTDSPVGKMREKLHQAIIGQNIENSAEYKKEQNKKFHHFSAQILGLSFPYALSLIAKSWLGSSTPTKEALIARFGKVPSEEVIFALADELGAEINLHKNYKKNLQTLPTPFIAEIKHAKNAHEKAIIIISLNDKYIKYIGANGVKQVAIKQILQNLTFNFITVFQAIDKRTETRFNRSEKKQNLADNSLSARLIHLAKLCFSGNMKEVRKMLVSAALSNSLLVTLPLFITIVYDRVVPHGAFETLTALTIGVVLALLIDIGLRSARVNLQEAIGVRAALRLQALAYRKLVTIPLQAGQRVAKGFFTLLPEIENAALIMPAIISGILADLPFVIIMLGLIYILTGPVVFVPIIGIILIAITVFASNIRASKNAENVHKAKIKVQDQAIETCATLATTKATRSEHLLLNRWIQNTDNSAYLTHKTRQTMAISQQLVLNITQMVIVMTIVAGAIQVNAGAMTLGNLAAATLLVGRVISPVSQLIAQLGQFSAIQISVTNIFSLLAEEEEFGGDEARQTGKKIKGEIIFNKVSFAYEGAKKQSLDNVSLTIRPKEKIGIIGRNGCGKSTLLKMIVRFYLPKSGNIMIDGVESRQISPFLLRQSIGFMSQDTILMNGTIRENICAGLEEIDEEEFEKIVQISGVANFTKNHPEGYNLNVGARGEHLSGGERQAVGLARAMLRNPDILILDEPTSAMDNSAEDRLINELSNYLQDKTVIIATHRMQLLKLVDRIIWMDSGRIIADGAKDEVLASLVKKAS